jgi:hypothetical protein
MLLLPVLILMHMGLVPAIGRGTRGGRDGRDTGGHDGEDDIKAGSRVSAAA